METGSEVESPNKPEKKLIRTNWKIIVPIIVFLLVFVTAIIVVIVILLKNESESDLISTSSTTPSYDDSKIIDYPKEDIRDMCQFLENELTGSEGDDWLKDQKFEKDLKMRGMFIIFRHGDRSPFSLVEDPVGCRPAREVDQQNFEEYKKLADSDDVINFLKVDPLFASYHRYPEDSNCVSGNLTAEGALQHLKLGKFLREKYSKSGLLKGDQEVMTKITTTPTYRTLQSALAFSTEFLYPQKELIKPVKVKVFAPHADCPENLCRCPASKPLRKNFDRMNRAIFNDMKKQPIAAEIRKMIKVFNESEGIRSLHSFIDVALGKYICRRRELPCIGDKCMTIDLLNKVADMVSKISASTDDIMSAKKYHVMATYAFSDSWKRKIQQIRENPTKNFIDIISAHDVTVASILRTLGVSFVDRPHYTSRLIFEIYEHKKEGMFIRFIFNGNDRSKDVRFCQGDDLKFGMCRAKAFEKYMEKGIFDWINVKKPEEACSET